VSDTSIASLEVRDGLVDALKLDLVGPRAGHVLSDERLPGWVRPSNWYLAGFLIPSGMSPEKSGDADEDDDIDVTPEIAGLGEESNEERKAAKKGFFPSSMGLSFLVPKEARGINVIVRWGDYAPTEIDGDDGKPMSVWQRKPQERTVPMTFTGAKDPAVHNVPDSGGLQLHLVEKIISAQDLEQHIPQGTRSVSVFLVNNRTPAEEKPDAAFVFQQRLTYAASIPLCRGQTCAAHGPLTGTIRWPIFIMPIRLNTPLATASRQNGSSWIARADSSAVHGYRVPRCKKRRPWLYRTSSCRWRRSGR
jgi:hypothetical protein